MTLDEFAAFVKEEGPRYMTATPSYVKEDRQDAFQIFNVVVCQRTEIIEPFTERIHIRGLARKVTHYALRDMMELRSHRRAQERADAEQSTQGDVLDLRDDRDIYELERDTVAATERGRRNFKQEVKRENFALNASETVRALDPESVYLLKERVQEVERKAAERLTHKELEIWQLHCEEYSERKIAEFTGISHQRVHQLIDDIRKKLCAD